MENMISIAFAIFICTVLVLLSIAAFYLGAIWITLLRQALSSKKRGEEAFPNL